VATYASAGELQALHVAPFGPAKGQDALASEQVERERVDAFLVNDDKTLVVAVADLVAPARGPGVMEWSNTNELRAIVTNFVWA